MKRYIILALSLAAAAYGAQAIKDLTVSGNTTLSGNISSNATQSGGTFNAVELANSTIGGKTLNLGGNVTFSGAFHAILNVTANTSVTMPTSGTLSTLGGSETLLNKTLTAPVINGGSGTNIVLSQYITAGTVKMWHGLGGDSRTVSVGPLAGAATTSGIDNTFFGAGTGNANTSGSMNVFIGADTGSRNTIGNNNTGGGFQALLRLTKGTHNAAWGKYAFSDTTTGTGNDGSGYAAGVRNITGNYNTHHGYEAGHDNLTGGYNTGIGFRALVSTRGADGAITAFANAGGGSVTVTSAAHGRSNGNSIVIDGTTSYNGTFTVANATTNTFTIVATWVADDATGTWRLSNNQATENTAIGSNAGKSNTTGYRNTFLGAEAGNVGQAGGYNTSTAIGYGASFDADNQIALGTTTEIVKLYGGRVQFPATQIPSANKYTLDDYREDTWTAATSTGTGTIALVSNTGSYIKIGRKVTVTGKFTVGSISSPTGNFLLTGLPFPCASGIENAAAVSLLVNGATSSATTSWVGVIQPGSSNISLYTYSAGGVAGGADKVVANTTEIYVNATYFTTN